MSAESLPSSERGWRRWRTRVREKLVALVHEGTTPARLGLAVGLGILVGCTPLYGLQTVLVLALAWVLRLNKVAALAGSQISIPPLMPLLAFTSGNLGELLLRHRTLPLPLAKLRAVHPEAFLHRFVVAWAVGSIILGTVLGLLLGTVTALIIARRRRANPRHA